MDREEPRKWRKIGLLAEMLPALLLAVALLGAMKWAPTEATMGDAQRILYLHVAVAWLGLVGFLAMAGTGSLYLWRRNLAWDHWSRAAAELGWLCSGLTLATGSLWAHAAWDVWWSWDPRLTSSFVLWVLYGGILLARGNLADAHRRARIGAVLAIVGALDIPLVIMATRWFRGIHPVAPEMEPGMRLVLMLSVAGFTLFFAVLLVRRRLQLEMEFRLAALAPQHDGQ